MNLNAVLHHIPPLDLDHLTQLAPAVEEYARFYHLDFSEQLPDVRHHIGSFSSGSFDLVCQLFLLPQARGTVFVVHGYYDHVGLYAALIGHLLGQNYAVVAFDLPGHGLSTGEAATISSFSYYDRALEDCLLLCRRHVPAPLHVVGQSTGGAAVMSYLLRQRKPAFERVVLLAPLVRPKGWRLGRIAHTLLSPFVKQLPRSFRDNSHDSDFVDFVHHKDPLQCKHLKLSWVSALKRWLKWFLKLPPSDCPLLVIQGKVDNTVDWHYDLRVIREKFPAAKIMYLEQADHHLVGESRAIQSILFQGLDLYLAGAEVPDSLLGNAEEKSPLQSAT